MTSGPSAPGSAVIASSHIHAEEDDYDQAEQLHQQQHPQLLQDGMGPVSYTHLTLPTIYSV